jgi:hypothetical protein
MKKIAGRSIRPFYMFFNTEGMDQRSGPMLVQPTSAELIQNLHYDKAGSFSAYRQGCTSQTIGLESESKIDGLAWFTDSNGVDYLLAAVNGKVNNIDPTTGAVTSQISTGLTAGNSPDFETLNGNIYCAEASTNPLKWAGSSTMSSTSIFPLTVGAQTFEKPKLAEKYRNRMIWGNFNSFPSHIAISDDLNPEACTTATTNATDGAIIKVSPGDGQKVVGYRSISIYTANGVEEILLILKDRSAFTLSGSTPSNFSLQSADPAIGSVSNRAITRKGNDVLWMGESGIYSLSSATQANGLRPLAIGSKDVIEITKSLNLSQKSKCWAEHHPERQEVWFALPTGSSTEVDTLIIYHYPVDEKETSTWTIRKNITECCSLILNKVLFTGDNKGNINKWFGSSKYKGISINWVFKNHYYNFNSQGQDKQILELFAWFLVYAPETVNFKYKWRNGGNDTGKTITKTIDVDSGSVYGTVSPPAGVYGQSVYGAGAVLKKMKLPVFGNGEQLQFEISGNTGDTAPIFLGYSGWVEYLGAARSYK